MHFAHSLNDSAREVSPIRNQCASVSVHGALHGQSLGSNDWGSIRQLSANADAFGLVSHTTPVSRCYAIHRTPAQHVGTLRQPGACLSARRAGPRQPFATVCQEEAAVEHITRKNY